MHRLGTYAWRDQEFQPRSEQARIASIRIPGGTALCRYRTAPAEIMASTFSSSEKLKSPKSAGK